MLAHLLGQYHFNNTTDFSQKPSKNKNNPCASKITLWLNYKYRIRVVVLGKHLYQKLDIVVEVSTNIYYPCVHGQVAQLPGTSIFCVVKRGSQYLSFSALRCCCVDQMKNECTFEMYKHHHVDGIWVYSESYYITTVKSIDTQWLQEK